MLASAGADTALDAEDELWVRLHESDAQSAKEWLERHPKLLECADTFVQLAEDGHEAGVQLMLDGGMEPDVQNRNQRTALHVACMNDHRAIARLLLSRGASLHKRDGMYGGTGVGWAHVHGKHQLRDELLDRSTDFFDLVRHGRHEQVRACLAQRPSLAQSALGNGNTALHLLAGDTPEPARMLDLLLGAGADINAKNNAGQTPLAVRREPEDELVMELLRARGAL